MLDTDSKFVRIDPIQPSDPQIEQGPRLNAFLRSPLPAVNSSPDSLRQFYFQGVPQTRLLPPQSSNGQPGAAGTAGTQGLQGEPGPPGPAGPTTDGITAISGLNGHLTLDFTGAHSVKLSLSGNTIVDAITGLVKGRIYPIEISNSSAFTMAWGTAANPPDVSSSVTTALAWCDESGNLKFFLGIPL